MAVKSGFVIGEPEGVTPSAGKGVVQVATRTLPGNERSEKWRQRKARGEPEEGAGA